jgi:hypothetical protein
MAVMDPAGTTRSTDFRPSDEQPPVGRPTLVLMSGVDA